MFNFFNKNKQSTENLIISNNVSRLREIVKNFNDKNTNNTNINNSNNTNSNNKYSWSFLLLYLL